MPGYRDKSPHLTGQHIGVEENNFGTLKGISILFAEDDPVNTLIIRKILERNGATVSHVADGRQALELALQAPFHCAVFDMRMPVMTGPEATMAIRASNHTNSDLPIIALTANNSEVDRAICLEAGMNFFLTKPARELELIETILAVCNRQKYSDICVAIDKKATANYR